MSQDVLDLFHPAVARWFRESFAAPTPAQAGGWPRIAAGESTLILAPTGSGKTLAAFLCAIDELLQHPVEEGGSGGVHTLYLSPLRALAADIERNLEVPLAGIRQAADALGLTLPEITVGMRTGDTPSSERQKMIRRPPSMLITTPESLHLLLTSPKAREMLRSVRYVIVDEIHAMAPSKRGSFLSLLLERLEQMGDGPLVRIGLSATQRPLERIASFLAGFTPAGSPRQISVVDAGIRGSVDLGVVCPVEDMTNLPLADEVRPSIWPAIYERLLGFVEEHTSTLIFANNRRAVERIAAEMNALAGHRLVRAHHGSVAKDERLRIESELKAGRLPALVATSSLELGIDIGAIDLVCQVEAPYSVASALQRVGRAGHLVRETSKGRLIPKTRDDLLRMAGIAYAMLRGEISEVRIPRNALDVLAQQIVAMVAVEPWHVDRLFERLRCADPYHDLPRDAYLSVLDLLSGRHRTGTLPALRSRISWERATGMLHALPGTRHAAILNGGTIPDTGQYPMVLEDGKTRLGELDEEFVFERRVGETIILGTGHWKILSISHDRVIVAPSEEPEAQMPFWKGEGLGHDAEFGRRYGEFLRESVSRLSDPAFAAWIQDVCVLDAASAENLATYLRAQIERGGVVPDDRTLLVDAFPNEAGDLRIAILTTFGRSFHLALWLAISAKLRSGGIEPPSAVFSNAGILIRPGQISVAEIASVLRSLRPAEIEEAILGELAATPYFAARFRRNAVRALLLPRSHPGKRIPLWLQRLRAHDLLREAGQKKGFPIVTETYREVVEDILPMDEMRRVFAELEAGDARIVERRDRTPSPFSSSLLLDFTMHHLYLADRPAPEAQRSSPDQDAVAALLRPGQEPGEILDPAAAALVESRMQGTALFHRARDGVELVDLLQRIGDVTDDELRERGEIPALDAVESLAEDRRLLRTEFPGSPIPARWISAQDNERYSRRSEEDLRDLVRRHVGTRAPMERETILKRYPGSGKALDGLLADGELIEIPSERGAPRIGDPQVVAGIRRLTLAHRRRRVRISSAPVFSEFLLARHGLVTRRMGTSGLRDVLGQLNGCSFTGEVWREVLSARIEGFRVADLEELVRTGQIEWVGKGVGGQRRVALFAAGSQTWEAVDRAEREHVDDLSEEVLASMKRQGASFLHRIAGDLERRPSEIAEVLWNLVWKSRVTQDSLSVAWGARPDPARWSGSRSRTPWGGGRWSVVPDVQETGSDETTRRVLKTLLARYGILCREIVEADSLRIRWRDAYLLLSRMEWSGEVDRGVFLSGLSAPQFAERGVGQELGASEMEAGASHRPVRVHVNDPAVLYGSLIPVFRGDGEPYSVRHYPGNYLILARGRPVLAVEGRGERLISLSEMMEQDLPDALALLPGLVSGTGRPASLRVRTWNGDPIIDSPVAAELERLGFMQEDLAMILYRTYREAA